jgi:hypothetical protein
MHAVRDLRVHHPHGRLHGGAENGGDEVRKIFPKTGTGLLGGGSFEFPTKRRSREPYIKQRRKK